MSLSATCSPEYIHKRAKEIVTDVYQMPLVYMVGLEYGMDKKQVDKDKHKKYFIEYIITYLKT